MQEKIELNRVRNFSEIIEDSIQFFKQTWKPLLRAYFTICGFFWAASLIVGIFNQALTIQHRARGESPFGLTYFLSMGFELLNYLIISLTILCFIALYKEKGNEAPTVNEVWSYVKYFFFRTFGSYLALAALSAAGILFCLLPGIYLLVVFSLTLPIMIMENSTLGYAFNRSFKLIKNNWWFTLGVAFVTDIIVAAAMVSVAILVGIIVAGFTILTNANTVNIYSYVVIIVTHLVQFLYLLPLIGVTLTYFSLTEKLDDGTLLQRIMMLGKTPLAPTANEALSEEY